MLGSRSHAHRRAESRDAGDARGAEGTLPMLTTRSRPRGGRGYPRATCILLGFPLCQQPCPVGYSFPGIVRFGWSWALDCENTLVARGLRELFFQNQTFLSPAVVITVEMPALPAPKALLCF